MTPHIVRNERDQRDLSVTERERIIRKPFEERGERAPNWDALNTPSWEVRPSTEPSETVAATKSGKRIQEYKASPPEEQIAAAPQESRAAAPERYLLLAAVYEAGTPPQSLSSSNGLLGLVLPPGSSLSGFFRTGMGYRFQSDGYTADYVCLEVFTSPQVAFAEYPEGMKVSSDPVTYLNWHEPVEAPTLNARNWTAAP